MEFKNIISNLKKRIDKAFSKIEKAKYTLHVSSAIKGKAQDFVTTDDKLLKKLSVVEEIHVVNPL